MALRIAVVAPFLNEEQHLPRFLASLATQSLPPCEALLVDDGSSDGSPALAEAFASQHPWARAVRLPPRPPERDRLLRAAEYRAFQAGTALLGDGPDVIAKLDADLDLAPALFEELSARLEADTRLGIAGTYLSTVLPSGALAREHCPSWHVHGAVKFYRASCLAEIAPLAPILGWDGIDEHKARMLGWRTETFELACGDTLHLRPSGAHGGRLRHRRRLGMCDWAIGCHPLWVGLRGANAARRRPYVATALAHWAGWAEAGLRRLPRAEPDVRAQARREQLGRIRGRLSVSRPAPSPARP